MLSYRNEIERLAQGMPGRNSSTNTIVFIKKHQVPQDRAKDVTYGLITTLIWPEKLDEPNRRRLVAGGDRVHYPGDAGTPTANLLTVKLLLNSIISTPNAKIMTMDIKDFYLNTPMAQYEDMRLRLADMPEDVWNITAVLYSTGDRTTWFSSFSWRFCLIHLKVYEMSQACYLLWFNWRNSITCTHCNVISLGHNSIQQRAKSQRINVDTTTFCILWELFTIIKIFSSTFELDWKNWLPKTNQIWTAYVLWGC